MKKKVFTLLLVLFAIATTAQAQVVLNETNFPDANFRAVLTSILEISEGDEITAEKIAVTTSLNVGDKSIADLTGIEHFTALTELNCNRNQLVSLDVSKNTALTYLKCVGNGLTLLDVSKNTALERLDCQLNLLTELKVSKNAALRTLSCIRNRLTTLDMSGCTALTTLNFSNNPLTSLDISGCTALRNFDCSNYKLITLNASGCVALRDLDCNGNELTSLNVSGCTAMKRLLCYNNRLTSLDVSNCTALTTLNCGNNRLTELNVSNNTALTELYCGSNQLTELNVSNNTALTELYCGSNQLISLDLSNQTGMTTRSVNWQSLTMPPVVLADGSVGIELGGSLDVTRISELKGDGTEMGANYFRGNYLVIAENIDDFPGRVTYKYNTNYSAETTLMEVSVTVGFPLTEEYFPDAYFRKALSDEIHIGESKIINKEMIAKTTTLFFDDRNITDLTGIEHFYALEVLNCSRCSLTSLDVSKNTALTYLSCDGNQLTSLNISKNTALETLYCYNNQLTSLDVSNNTALTLLSCYRNQLTSLDISKNTALTYLNCGYNQLTALDVSKNTALTYLSCAGNQLTSLDVSKNTALTYLNCGYNQLTALDVSKNTALTELYCLGIQLTSLDVSKNTALTELNCLGNQLTSLDISKNITLERLYCGYNQLTTLDVSKNTALTDLYCLGNQLTSLDVSKNTTLQHLTCDRNQIKGEAMDALVASLPTINEGFFLVINTKSENEGNVCTKPQVTVAKNKGWIVYDYNINSDGDIIGFVEYEGSDPEEEDINPVDEGDNVDFGSDMDENSDLDGNVIGDIFYNIGNGNGEYNAEEGCIVLKKTTDDETVDGLSGKDIFGEDFKGLFTGIVFKVPTGKGTVKVTAETTGNMLLKVKIGDNEPVEMELNGKLKISFPYNVSETTLVAIYAGANNEAKGFGTTNDAEDAALKIYGIEFERDNTTSIDASLNDNGKMTNDSWYTIDGKKLSGEPTKKGVYIIKGKKVKR